MFICGVCIQLFYQRHPSKYDRNFQEDIAVMDKCHAEMGTDVFLHLGIVIGM